MPISKGEVISSLIEWEKLGKPKRPEHWVDGRSAKEAARAWLSGGEDLPAEVAELLASHPAFGEVLNWDAEPEARLRFDECPGEPRNSDLVVHATDAKGAYVVAVEAKADEPFGELVPAALAAAVDARLKNPQSNAVTRIEQLCEALLGSSAEGDVPLDCIRYQLLTACAGAIAEGEEKGCGRTLLLIHEFHTWKTTETKIAQNAMDLDRFLSRLTHGAVRALAAGQIVGPLVVPGAPLFTGATKFYVGKATRIVAESVVTV
ncbi:MAG: hypothetical protein ABI859_06725 [Pseudomonadota bacterium]